MSNAQKPTPAQQQAITRTAENIALRSGAGCGKTFVLARRFTELLAKSKDDNPLRQFVALTFTDKAALEMLQRVRSMLATFAAAATGEDRKRLLSWLEDAGEARISTIHSFCANLLRAHAVRAGLDPNFSVCADDMLPGQMMAAASEQAVLEAAAAQEPGAADLLGRIDLQKLLEMVGYLADHRTSWRAENYSDPAATLARWAKRVEAARREAWTRLGADPAVPAALESVDKFACADPGDKLLAYRDAKVAMARKLLKDRAARTAESFAALAEGPGKKLGSDKAWGGKEQASAVREGIKALLAAFEPYAAFAESLGELDRQAAEALATLTGLADRAVAIYTADKRQRGILDFTDLLYYSHRLLKENPDIRRGLGIKQLLIDEGQDTDGFQIEMLLMAVFPDEFVAGAELPDGRLFLVGDGKQSIYRFRGAQIEVFEELCGRIGSRRQVGLDTSFRTHKAGVEFVNHVFAPWMPGYERIEAVRPFEQETGRGPSVEIILADSPPGGEPIDSAEAAAEAQAAAVAGRIRQMLDAKERLVWDRDGKLWRPATAGDCAILFARMTNSLLYERELARRDIPYYIVAGSGFFKQQEVFDLLSALSAIDNPMDDVAFFGVLRGSLFGLDDNALVRIADALEPPYMPKLMAGASVDGLGDWQRRTLEFAVETLVRLHRIKDAVGIDELLHRIVRACGYDAVLLSQPHGRRMLGNVRMLIDQARSAGAAGMALADFVTQVSQRVMDESRYEQAAVSGEDEDVVRIMTIHKAKGLEFPVVFVPDLNSARRGVTDPLLTRADWGLTYAAADDSQEDDGEVAAGKPLSYRLAQALENEDARREDIRRLYVAMTRHEDHLVLVGANHRDKDDQLKCGGSYLQRLDALLDIRGAAEASADGGEIAYGPCGEYKALAYIMHPEPPKTKRQKTAGQELLERCSSPDDLAQGIVGLARAEIGSSLPLVGSLPAEIGRADVAVTMLSEFVHCPMLYHWRYELRVPRLEDVLVCSPAVRRSSDALTGTLQTNLDAATLGTLLHGCMEHLNFAHPQPAATLVAQQAEAMGLLDRADLAALAAEFERMVERLRGQELWGELASAKQVFRELDFVMDMGPARLRGQIDLLYQDAAGAWRLLDYKSDRIGDEGTDPHTQRYSLQLQLYARAAGRYIGSPISDALLYFLRTGQVGAVDVSAGAIAAVEARVGNLAKEMIHARRTGRYEQRPGKACEYCQYAPLCQAARIVD